MGRYEFHELLGRGGMASVYRATDRATGKDVALKQLSVAMGAPERARVAALFERVSRSMTGTQLVQERADTALGLVCTAAGASTGHLYLVSNEGVALRASHGGQSQPPTVGEVQAFIAQEQERAEALTERATGELEQQVLVTLVATSDTTFQLSLLSCVLDTSTKLAGVVAISRDAGSALDPRFAQLLSALAAHLLRAGDTPGIVRT